MPSGIGTWTSGSTPLTPSEVYECPHCRVPMWYVTLPGLISALECPDCAFTTDQDAAADACAVVDELVQVGAALMRRASALCRNCGGPHYGWQCSELAAAVGLDADTTEAKRSAVRTCELPRPISATHARTQAADKALQAAQTDDPIFRRELRKAAGRWMDLAIEAATIGKRGV